MRLIVTLVAATFALLASTERALPQDSYWSRGFFTHHGLSGDNDPQGPRFFVITIDGNIVAGRETLTANGQYDNFRKQKPARTVRLDGCRRRNGSFWPEVTLEIADDLGGPWRSVPASPLRGNRTTVLVAPGREYAMDVDLAPFRPFIPNVRWGKIILPIGDAAFIELKDLLPSKSLTNR